MEQKQDILAKLRDTLFFYTFFLLVYFVRSIMISLLLSMNLVIASGESG